MRWAVMNVNEVFSEDFLGGFLFRAVYNAIPCVDSFFLVNMHVTSKKYQNK